jgi:hypothetical protein
MRSFFTSLLGLARAHPLAFVLFLVGVVVLLGGVVWGALGFLFRLIRKVPGGGAVANAAEGAIDKAAKATGSA